MIAIVSKEIQKRKQEAPLTDTRKQIGPLPTRENKRKDASFAEFVSTAV
jgi:hypothetical protein